MRKKKTWAEQVEEKERISWRKHKWEKQVQQFKEIQSKYKQKGFVFVFGKGF